MVPLFYFAFLIANFKISFNSFVLLHLLSTITIASINSSFVIFISSLLLNFRIIVFFAKNRNQPFCLPDTPCIYPAPCSVESSPFHKVLYLIIRNDE